MVSPLVDRDYLLTAQNCRLLARRLRDQAANLTKLWRRRRMIEKTDAKQTDEGKPWQFQPGQSDNPTGRPKGARNAATVAEEGQASMNHVTALQDEIQAKRAR